MFIKVELDGGLAAVHVAFLRCAFGAATLLLILAITKDRLPRDRAFWRHVARARHADERRAVRALRVRGDRGLLAAGRHLQRADAADDAAVLDRAAARRAADAGEGRGARASASSACSSCSRRGAGCGGGSLLGALACIGAATCYGAAFPYLRRHVSGRPETGVAVSAAQVTIGRAAAARVHPVRGAARRGAGRDGVAPSSRSARSAPASPTSSTSTSCARRARRRRRWSPTSCRCSRSSSA